MTLHTRPRLCPRALVAALAVVGFSAVLPTSPVAAAPITGVDDGGPDDEPGQKDLTQLSIDQGTDPATVDVTFNFDDTFVSGANTLDGCALIDTNGNGNADYALCHTIDFENTQTTSLYDCTADDKADRCTGPERDPGYASTTSSAIVAGSDPFSAVAAHQENSACDTDPACYSDDVVVSANLVLADFGGAAVADLINVCSYPSQQPNSDPSDCVFTPDSGFLTIAKVAPVGDTTDFTFTTSEASANGRTEFVVNGSGQAARISFPAGTTVDVNEAAIEGYSLSGATCAINGATPGATGTPTATGIDDIEIRTGLTTTCTFTNASTEADLAIVKTASVAQAAAGSSFTYTLDVTNAGPGEAQNVVVTDTVPASLVVAGVTSSTMTCSNAGNVVTCTAATLAVDAAAQAVIAVNVSATAADGAIDNLAAVTADTPDSNSANNSDTAAVTLQAAAAPTTAAPSTTVAPVLPATGPEDSGVLALVALGLVGVGAASLFAARRRTAVSG